MIGLSWVTVFLAGLVDITTSLSAQGSKIEEANVAVYDYVIIGCGAAGLTVATRLSEIPDITVLCLEAGPFDQNEPQITIPYYIGLQPEGFYDWQIHTVGQTQLDGLPRHVTMGKGVGGGTLINGMIWSRGNRDSFNSWANIGNPGWSWAELLPYFIRSEQFTPKKYAEQRFLATPFNRSLHGSTGYVQISYPDYFWNQSNNWFHALESLGIPIATDPNDGLSAGGYFLPLTIDPISQTRSDARRTYYKQAAPRKNFHAWPNAHVTRIIFNISNDIHAIAVEYVQGSNGSRNTVNVRQEVILAAGAIHTPQILELSGIGQASILQRNGMQVLQDLPGVGNNLQDHALIHLDYSYTDPLIVSINDFVTNHTFNDQCAAEYYNNRTGPWTAKPSQAVAFPSLHQFAPHASAMLNWASVNASAYLPACYESTLLAGYDRQLSSIVAELRRNNTPALEILNNNAGGLDIGLMRPLSRGTSHIRSTDPFDSPAVDPRWLVHPFDHSVMIAAMEFNQKLLATPALSALQPTYVDVPYNATTDQLDAMLRTSTGTEYHYCGTAAMMPRELGGVVDTDLIVYGTNNVRVVDTSVYPMVPGAHLQAVAYAVAERAADLIKGVANY